MTHLIGLTGVAGSGKDACAQILVRSGWRRIAFADPVRNGLLALDPYVADNDGVTIAVRLSELLRQYQGDWDSMKRNRPEVRRLLQRYGTEAGRNIHGPDCWLDIAESKWLAATAPVVVTDVRFPNERQWVRERSGRVLRVDRPGVGPVNGHVSDDIAGLPVDRVIINDGTLGDLERKTLDALQSLGIQV